MGKTRQADSKGSDSSKKRKVRKNGKEPQKGRKTGQKLTLTALLVILVFAFARYVIYQNSQTDGYVPTDTKMSVYYIDVGQGDSELIVSDGKTLLIDAGEPDAGADVIRCLKKQNIARLDYVIATHPHSDHIGGLSKVIEEFDVGKIIMPKLPVDMVPTTKLYEKLLNTIADKKLKITPAKAGEKYQLGSAEIEILTPVGSGYDNLNDYSVVCRITCGETTFMFTGDAGETVEKEIVDSGYNVAADVLKVGHHGSKTSSGYIWLKSVNPAYSVISCGAGNSYNHPNKETIKRIKKICGNIYRTDLNGTVVCYSDGKNITFELEKGGDEK